MILKLVLQDIICQVCPKDKQTRVSFPKSSIKTTRPFELIHIHVWGPHTVKTTIGYTQFLKIVDDYSRFTWIDFLKNKTYLLL